MLCRIHKVFLIFLFLLGVQSFAQVPTNKRFQWVKKDQAIRDSLTIDFGSVQIYHIQLSSGILQLEPAQNTIRLEPWPMGVDSVLIGYRVYPMVVHGKKFRRSLSAYDTLKSYTDGIIFASKKESREEIFATQGINKTGNIIRGVSFGNNQDVFVNSSLNLQLEGKLTPDIKMIAAISDQNVPLQPDGNTQNLQQFDRVYTQFEHAYGKLNAGDVILKDRSTYFLKYQRNVQGLLLDLNYPIIDSIYGKTYGGVSFSKGKFASQFIEVTEGVQGPYRLRGPNNEQFIIILANSEKVFLDGRLLQRGFDRDYTIDYNQSLIRFNNNVVITKFSRVRIDFEFNDRNYSRITMVAGHTQAYKNFTGYFHFYSERDDPNALINITLTDEAKQQLALVGDSVQKAVTFGATSVSGFNNTQILYTLVDTNVAGIIYTNVLVRALRKDSNQVYYTSTFSDRGQGNGNYISASSGLSNGLVYVWVAPVAGRAQGRYEPVRTVPLPSHKQIINIGGNYSLGKYGQVYLESAISKNDVNLYSPPEGRAVDGYALKGGYRLVGLPVALLPKYVLSGNVDYEFNQKNFSPIDRFRSVEFDRDWSGNVSANQFYQRGLDDNIFSSQVGMQKDKLNSFSYGISQRIRGSEINGTQHKARWNQSLRKFQLENDFFYLTNDRKLTLSDWVRYTGSVYFRGEKWVPGYTFILDKNRVKPAGKDSVTFSAMNYEQHTVYFQSADTLAASRFKIDYNHRTEFAPVQGVMQRSNLGQTINFFTAQKLGKTQDLTLLVTYRNLENFFFVRSDVYNPNNLTNANTSTTFTPRDETIQGRLDWNGDFFNRAIRSEFTYASSTGRELKRQFQYIKVPTGQGSFTWRDDNGDGIEQLNEFYAAINFDEKNYIRFFIPTDQFVKVYQNTFNYRLNITPPATWKNEGGLKAFIGRFSNVSSWRIDRKITDDQVIGRFWPFYNNIAAENILSTEQIVRSNVFFNRTNPVYGLELGFVASDQKTLLVNGFSGKSVREWQLNTRANVYSTINLKLNSLYGLRGTNSDFLLNQNYLIRIYQLKPEVAWQPIDVFRIGLTYSWDNKRNIQIETGETALLQSLLLDMKFNKLSSRTIQGNIRYVNINYNGIINSPIGYEMLEALQPGNNFTWSINIQQKLTNGLQITLNYEGRSSQNQRVVHIGRMQVSVLF